MQVNGETGAENRFYRRRKAALDSSLSFENNMSIRGGSWREVERKNYIQWRKDRCTRVHTHQN